MKRRLLSLLTLVVLFSLVILPQHTMAGTKEDIDKKLADIKRQEAAATKSRQEADKAAAEYKALKNQEIVSMKDLVKNIRLQGAKLDDLNAKIEKTSDEVKVTGEQLVQAEDRVATRDKLLKSRVKTMYMNGSVSYIDVLVSATSFSDFLDRFEMLKSLVGQDRKILDENKKDRNTVVEKKKQVEDQLAKVKTLYAEAEQVNKTLEQQEKQKEVVIASLSDKEQIAEEISEDQEQSLVALAKKKASLYEQKNAILKEEQRQREIQAAKSSNKGGTVPPVNISKNGKFAWPVPSSNTITSTFGYRIDPISHTNKLHKGVDIGAPNGTTIVAAEDGVVLIASWTGGYGNTVVINHGNGIWTWYGHIRNGGIKVTEGQTVRRGDKIAEVGSTGDSTGNHLHFEVRINEKPVEPMTYLR